MYTRKQLCQKYKLSLATVRRLLQLLSIKPAKIQYTNKNLPIYFYSQEDISLLEERIINAAQYKQQLKKTCSICKQKTIAQLMIGTRCYDCYIDKCCRPIIFGKQPWKKLLNNTLIDKAIKYLTSFKQATKSDQ